MGPPLVHSGDVVNEEDEHPWDSLRKQDHRFLDRGYVEGLFLLNFLELKTNSQVPSEVLYQGTNKIYSFRMGSSPVLSVESEHLLPVAHFSHFTLK